jgi:hypothetical protein
VYVPGHGWLEFDPTPPDPTPREMNLRVQIAHYIDALELFWNSYVLIYDSGVQSRLFHSAQDSVLSIQTSMREKSDRWTAFGQILSERLAARLRRVIETVWFWAMFMTLVAAIAVLKNRRAMKTQFRIWRLRHGRGGVIDESIVEELFYRAACLAEGSGLKRQPQETWREWIFGLPDPTRRTMLKRALEVFERSRYGRMPASIADFILLEDTIRELKG